MKTIKVYLLILFLITTIHAKAQMLINSNGLVGINNPNPSAQLDIIPSASTTTCINFNAGNNTGVNSFVTNGTGLIVWPNPTQNWTSAMTIFFLNSNFNSKALQVTNVNTLTYQLMNNGMALMSGALGVGVSWPSYAVDVNGQIRATNVAVNSDSSLKSNIQTVIGARASIQRLRGVTYKFKAISNTTAKSDSNTIANKFVGDTSFLSRTHIGFIAQELQKVYPELVYTDKNGLLSVDYMGLIPILVESIKDLTVQTSTDSLDMSLLNKRIIHDSIYFENQLQSLLTQLNQCCENSKTKSEATSNNMITESDQLPSNIQENGLNNSELNGNSNVNDASALYQNSPNPFNLSTTIGYNLASSAGTANIYVYNMVGTQLKSIQLYGTGRGNITINGNELSAGMYLYALVVDGKIIDTKRMILTN